LAEKEKSKNLAEEGVANVRINWCRSRDPKERWKA